MIPESVDLRQLLCELNELGWIDYKISLATGLDHSYISQIKNGKIKRPSYEYTALLYNFHQAQVAQTSHQVVAHGST